MDKAVPFVKRKLGAMFLATAISSLFLAFSSDLGAYDRGNQLFGWFLFLFLYIGAVIGTYGNLVSIGIEFAQRRWFKRNDWLFIILHGLAGLVVGTVFQEQQALNLFGAGAAVLYACIDRILEKKLTANKGIKPLLTVPLILLFLSWASLQIVSPSAPPFTAVDAITFATSGEGTAIENFPDKAGKWQGIIDGYQVERKTQAEELSKETYRVTFTENWSKGMEVYSWSLAYSVDRNSMKITGEQGKMPPYYEND